VTGTATISLVPPPLLLGDGSTISERKKHKKREEKNMKLLGDREAALFGGLALGSFGSSQDPGGRTQAAQVHCRWG